MKAMYIPEAYYNKTSLDGHFATAGKQMRASVIANAGKANAFDAASMFTARTSHKAKGTVSQLAESFDPKTQLYSQQGAVNYVVHYEPNRDRLRSVKKNAIPGLKKLAERVPVWVRNTRANRIALSRQKKEAAFKRMTCKELKVTYIEYW